MRGLVFVLSVAATLLLLASATEATWPFALAMSVCVAAVVSTAVTADGRVAARRIATNARVGWTRRA